MLRLRIYNKSFMENFVIFQFAFALSIKLLRQNYIRVSLSLIKLLNEQVYISCDLFRNTFKCLNSLI